MGFYDFDLFEGQELGDFTFFLFFLWDVWRFFVGAKLVNRTSITMVYEIQEDKINDDEDDDDDDDDDDDELTTLNMLGSTTQQGF